MSDQSTTPARSRPLSRRNFIRVVLAAPALTGLYAWRIEPHWLEVVNRDLPIAHLPDSLAGRTLVQLSDLHIGPKVDDDYVIDTFRRVASLQPDIVVHTGDLVSYRDPRTIEQARRVLAHFPRGRLGTAAILGNHDYGRAWSDMQVAARISNLLSDTGAMVLRNATTVIAGLQIAGLDDLWSGRFQPWAALRAIDSTRPALVLCHNPDACDRPVWGNYRGWILAGHTHGGQCKPPFLPPPMLPVLNKRYTSGEFSLSGGRHLYISRGVGHLMPVRFNARPEVTVFRLQTA